MVRFLLCDDDNAILELCRRKIEAFFSEMGMRCKIHAYTETRKISTQIMADCDIAILDIDLGKADQNGMDLARKLRSLRPDVMIIFVTNYIEYAPEGYEVQAFRYLLKRQLDTELVHCIELAMDRMRVHAETFKMQIGGELLNLPLEEIVYFEVQQHTVTLFVQKEQVVSYRFNAALSDIEAQLENKGFLRIHKSYLVNMRYLRRFQCREALLTNGETLRVSEKSYAQNKQKYLRWKGWN